jgi:hypothetical protein
MLGKVVRKSDKGVDTRPIIVEYSKIGGGLAPH